MRRVWTGEERKNGQEVKDLVFPEDVFVHRSSLAKGASGKKKKKSEDDERWCLFFHCGGGGTTKLHVLISCMGGREERNVGRWKPHRMATARRSHLHRVV